MRRSTLIALGYAGFGVLFLVNAVTGAGFRSVSEIEIKQRMTTWGILGVIWLLISAYALLQPEQFNTKTEERTKIGYAFMFSVVFIVLLVLSAGVLFNLIVSVI